MSTPATPPGEAFARAVVDATFELTQTALASHPVFSGAVGLVKESADLNFDAIYQAALSKVAGK